MSSVYASLDDYWKKRAQDELLEDPTKVEANICALRTLVQGERGLYSRTDDTFLLAFLRARKHNVNAAFTLVKNFYKIQKAYPKQFEDCLPSEKGYVYDKESLTILDQKDNNGRIVMVVRVEKADYKNIAVEKYFQQISTAFSFYCEDPHVQIAGITILIDLKGFGLRHVFVATPSNAAIFVKMFQDSFPVRTKAVHVVHEPALITTLFNLIKPLIREKLRNRFHFHGTNVSSLHTHIPCEMLPKQLGGMIPNFNFDSFRNIIQKNEGMIKAWRKYGYNKKSQENSQSANC